MSGLTEAVWFSFVLGMTLKGTAVLGLAGLAALLMRSRSAAARHLVWTAAFAAMLLLPLLSVSLPALPVPLDRTILPTDAIFQVAGRASAGDSGSRVAQGHAAPVPAPPTPHMPDWRWLVVIVWAGGAAVAFARTLVGWAAIRRIRKGARPSVSPEAAALTRALGIRHAVEMLESPTGTMPMAFGLLRPAVLLPAGAQDWDQERRRMVLRHELAHVRRGDIARHLVARAALNLHWWNPAAWLAWREFLKEREHATDDMVLSAGEQASEYAGHLLEIARTMQLPEGLGRSVLAMVRRSQLEGRLQSILDSCVNRQVPGQGAVWATALLAVALVVPLAALRAQDVPEALPADIDAALRSARAEKNHEVLDKLAKTAIAARKYPEVRKLLEASLAIRGSVFGQQSADYAVGLLRLGDLERNQGRSGEADALYTKALAVLGDQPASAPALIHLGVSAIGKRNFDQASDYLERARLAATGGSGLAKMWTAVVREKQGRAGDADLLYRGAMAEENPGSPDAATIMEVYAGFLGRQGNSEEAESLQNRATALRKTHGEQRPAAGPSVYRIGNGVAAPKLIFKIEPEYTNEARVAQLQGTVVLYVDVGPDGMPHGLSVVRGLGLGLDDKAIDAIGQWKFKPGTRDGQPVTVAAQIEVNFRLL